MTMISKFDEFVKIDEWIRSATTFGLFFIPCLINYSDKMYSFIIPHHVCQITIYQIGFIDVTIFRWCLHAMFDIVSDVYHCEIGHHQPSQHDPSWSSYCPGATCKHLP